jgi:hypothetical protein
VKSRLSVIEHTISFRVDDGGSSIVTSGNASIQIPFLKFAAIPSLPLASANGAEMASSFLEVGKNAKTNFDVAMILDTTGSMATGTKLADLKAAAKDLVDVLVWENQGQFYSKIAVVPYATAVQVGSYAESVRGKVSGSYCYVMGRLYYKFRKPREKPRPTQLTPAWWLERGSNRRRVGLVSALAGMGSALRERLARLRRVDDLEFNGVDGAVVPLAIATPVVR